MRITVVSVGILLLILSITLIVQEAGSRPVFLNRRLCRPEAIPKGTLPLPEAVIQKSLTEAKAELDSRLQRASSDRWWARAVSWTSFLLASVLTVVAGSYGASAPTG